MQQQHWRLIACAAFLASSIPANSQTPAHLEDPDQRRQFAATVLAVVDAGCVPLQNDGHSVYYVNLALDQLFPEGIDTHPEDDVIALRSSLSYAMTANYIQVNPCASVTMQAEFHRLTSVLESYGERLSKAGVTPPPTAGELAVPAEKNWCGVRERRGCGQE